MNSESSLNSRYRGRAVEFFIGIFDSDSARISRKRCTSRTQYILHSRERDRALTGFADLSRKSLSRSLFIEIYSPKHSGRRRPRYHSRIKTEFSPLRILVRAVSLGICIRKSELSTADEIHAVINRFSTIWLFLRGNDFLSYRGESGQLPQIYLRFTAVIS